MFSEGVLILCLLVGSGSSYGPNYRVPSVYTPASYLDQQQQQYQPQYTSSFGPSQQQQPFQYQSQSPNFLQPQQMQAQWPSPSNHYWPQPQPQAQQQPFPSGQSPSLLNQFQPLLPSYPPNSLIVIYYRKAAKDAASQQSQPQIPVDQQTTAVRGETGQSPNSNRYPHICKGEGIVRHPDDCLKFIRCRLSLRHHVYYYEERTCPRGLAFDPELETCNYKGKVATCSRFHSASDPSADKTNQQQTTQSLLSYHGELPEPEKIDEEASLSSSSNPSLYMLDLPTLLSDSSEDAGNQLEGNAASSVDESRDSQQNGDVSDSSLASVPLAGKNADGGEMGGLKSPPPATKTVKKPSQSGTKKSPSRKTVSKRPSSGTKSVGSGTKSKPVVQEKEITPARKTQQVETFSIGDSENARMMVNEDDVEEDQQKTKAVSHRQKVNSYVGAPKETASVSTEDHQAERSSVHYEDDDANEEETLASSV